MSRLPFSLIESASLALQQAAADDLAFLRQELGMRCVNTIVVTDLEKVLGIDEFLLRVGPKKASENRFGKGCEIWHAADAKRLTALATQALGAFETWIHRIFADVTLQGSKTRLFRLLARIQGRFAENFTEVMAKGFGMDSTANKQLAQQQFFVGGCYFCATGSEENRQAFVKSVFTKVIEQASRSSPASCRLA